MPIHSPRLPIYLQLTERTHRNTQPPTNLPSCRSTLLYLPNYRDTHLQPSSPSTPTVRPCWGGLKKRGKRLGQRLSERLGERLMGRRGDACKGLERVGAGWRSLERFGGLERANVACRQAHRSRSATAACEGAGEGGREREGV
eukprot:3367110-Pleurochrysis_carterae.AAC.2